MKNFFWESIMLVSKEMECNIIIVLNRNPYLNNKNVVVKMKMIYILFTILKIRTS